MRIHNFSAGPGVLPLPVLQEIQSEIPEMGTIGTTVMEISHRSKPYDAILESAEHLFQKLLGIDEQWQVLFLQGGASMQFMQVPMNFLSSGQTAAYLNTGTWAKKAIKEAKRFGNVHIVASSEADNFSHIPDVSTWDLPNDANYLHYTANNTIFGTEFHFEPDAPYPLVCDASSNFMSRPIDVARYGLIYAGAQKNLGPSGVTVVLIRKDFLEKRNADVPTILDYGTHAKELFNTPPVFAVYVVEKVLRWLDGLGGIEAIEAQNIEKANKLYRAIDRTGFYYGTAHPTSRSRMNVCFRIQNHDLEKTFIEEAKAAHLVGLGGHRSVGGMRASIYNACPPESVDALIAFMEDFEKRNG